MKKTLLIAAAALAAGVISSQAQVYSQNIVGYVNKPLPLGYSVVSVPLNGNGNNNALTNVIDNSSGALNGCYLYSYTGTSYAIATFDNNFPSGFGDASDLNDLGFTPVMNPGKGFIINNNSGVPLTNTFVGSVAIASLPGLCTNSVVANKSFIASVLPIGGGVISSLQFTNDGSLNGAYIYIPNIVNGNIQGYQISTFDNGFITGFGDAADLNQAPEPIVPVAGGFIMDNNIGAGTLKWIQSL